MKKVWIILSILAILLVIGVVIWYVFGGIRIKVIGGDTIVTYNTEYKDEGIQVLHHGKVVESNKYRVNVDGDVDTSVLGDYQITYYIKYRQRKFEKVKKVSVVDNVKPEIKPNMESVERDYCTKKDKKKLEYTVIDNYDGDITELATLDEDNDNYIIKAEDKSGNIMELSIPITYTKKPDDIFKLNGNSTVYVKNGSKYNESGVTYTDGCGNKLEGVKTSGNVDTSKNGNYTITYTVNDKKLTRTVNVYTPNRNSPSGKVIYLTFDDGPGSYTERVLNTLKKYDVKATFFVTHQFGSYVPLIKKEYDQGHSVAVHSYTHNWNIYKSVDAYLNDFNKMNNDILRYTGEKAKIFRFPGGSSNTVSRNYAKGVVKAIANRMTNDGYVYFDWDVDSGDAAGASRNKIYNNVVNGVKSCSKCIVLMHDIKINTVNELDNILNTLVGRGYKFGALSTSSPTVHHRIAN